MHGVVPYHSQNNKLQLLQQSKNHVGSASNCLQVAINLLVTNFAQIIVWVYTK